MQISSSVSASPMQRNLNSLRESANLRLAADRPVRERERGDAGVRGGKSPPRARCRRTHNPSWQIPRESEPHLTGGSPKSADLPRPRDGALQGPGQHPAKYTTGDEALK